MAKKFYTYDIEVLPNYFSVIFKLYNKDDNYIFELQLDDAIDQLNELRQFIKNNVGTLIGFNSHRYDDIIIKYILFNDDITNEKLFELSKRIIYSDTPLWKDNVLKRYTKSYPYNIRSVDLLKLYALNKVGVSLKQVAVVLKHDNILDFPQDPLKNLQPEDKKAFIDYNYNDVIITEKLLNYALEEINLRAGLSKQYNIDLLSASRTKVAKTLLDLHLKTLDTIDFETLRNERTHRDKIDVAEILESFEFQTPQLIGLYDKLKKVTLKPNQVFTDIVKTKKMRHKLGKGGLHSMNKNEVYEANDEYVLYDIDAGSFYPTLMINYHISPKHLGDEFINVVKTNTVERLKAKANKDKLKAESLKISINSYFGLLGSETYLLYDPQASVKVTINGQLMILRTIEYFEQLDDVTCIYSNTDGASFRVKRSLLPKIEQMRQDWEKHTNIIWEAELYSKFILKDVNNYIWISEKGEIKSKGLFSYKQDITKGYVFPVISKALFEYFTKDVNPETFLKNHDDILDFCASQRSDKKFRILYKYLDNNKLKVKTLQRTNRYFASTTNGSIVKYDPYTESETSLLANENIYVLNKYEPTKDYKDIINYNFYLKQINKVINSLEVKQLNLF